MPKSIDCLWRRTLIVCLAAALCPPPAAAQSTSGDSASSSLASPSPVFSYDDTGRVVVRATRVAEALKIDGKLDEPAYEQIAALTTFVQQEPNEGEPVSERTEAWVMFDDDNVYFACRCWDRHPERMVANDMRRDSMNLRQNDNFAVALDTFHDRRSGFLFNVTAIGAIYDSTMTDDRSSGPEWNAVFETKPGRFDGGWIIEIAIPFKSLRYKAGREQTWGINIRRTIRSKNESAYLSPLQAAWGVPAINRVSAAGTLVGLEAPPAGKNLEIKPYAIGGIRTDRLSQPTVENAVDRDAGLDIKYGVTKSLTADFTYNTDFAQVEDDEAQVNLTRFSLFLPEKREFFLESRGIFAFGTGGAGAGMMGGGGGDGPTLFYSRRIGLSEGRAVPIVGGGRLTGKAGPWSIGTLNIQSDDDAAARAEQTNFTVVRLKRDVLGRSAIGALFTSRSASTVAAGSNQVFGVDANFAFFENVYVGGFLARSRTDGLARKDLSYRAQFQYAADRYGLQFDRIAVEKNFNPEIGFLPRENFRSSSGSARFSPRPEANGTIRQYHYETTAEYTTDTDNRLESRALGASFRMDLQSSDALTLSYARNYEFLAQPFRIADGVRIPVGGYGFQYVTASYNLGQQHRLAGSVSANAGSFYSGTKTTATFRGRFDFTPQLAVEPNLSLNWIDLPEGAFTTTVAGGRVTLAMTPRMILAALVQYSSSSTSVSSNVRFRWEYQPGSELFVVYTEGRDTFPSRATPLESRGFVVKINRLLRF